MAIAHLQENKSNISLNYMIYKSRLLNFALIRKLGFYTIYNAYSNESPFKYDLGILGRFGGLRPYLFCLFRRGRGVQNLGKPAYIILERSQMIIKGGGGSNALKNVYFNFFHILPSSAPAPTPAKLG